MPLKLLANQNSVHVKRWLHLYRNLGQNFEFITAMNGALSDPGGGRWPFLGYCLLGISAFLRTAPTDIIHAHSAGGFGLSAYVSRRKYILTVYGTEILGLREHQFFRLWITGKILRRASVISCTTTEMRDVLVIRHGISPDKVACFSLGIDTSVFRSEQSILRVRRGRRVVFIHNRRCHRHYNLDAVIDAFEELVESGNDIEMRVFSGDAQQDYLIQIARRIENIKGCSLVSGFRSQTEIAELLGAADFSISVPSSDQLSASILEAMISGAIPILAPLKAYDTLFANGVALRVREVNSTGIAEAMRTALGLSSTEIKRLRLRGAKYVEEFEGDKEVEKKVKALLRTANVS